MLDFAQHLVTNTDLSVLNFADLNFADLHSHIHIHIHMDLIAQQFKQDIAGDFGRGWNNFVKTGQIWALMIGIAVGYMFRSISMG